MKSLMLGLLCVTALGCVESNRPDKVLQAPAQQPKTTTTNRPVMPDTPAAAAGATDRTNTGINVRDRDGAAKTPLDQNQNQADISLTADIRQRVVNAADMSLNARNVKIVSQDGKVTLRGPVQTDQEKQQIETIANEVAGAGNVDSQLEVNRE